MMKKIFKYVLILGLIICFLYYQNNGIQVSHMTYKHQGLPDSFDGYKVLHLSDLHNKNFRRDQSNLVDHIQDLNPHIICITGDLIDGRKTDLQPVKHLLEQLKGQYPIYYVSGNHEYSSGKYHALMDLLQDFDVMVLDNQVIDLKVQGASINLLGLSDPLFNQNAPYDTLIDMNLHPDRLNLLLAHRPEYIEAYEQAGVDLVLSGHAHGGQFRLPFIGGIYSPGQGWFPNYSEGQHEIGQTTLIISRGLGNSIFPQRLFNRPELILITLKNQ